MMKNILALVLMVFGSFGVAGDDSGYNPFKCIAYGINHNGVRKEINQVDPSFNIILLRITPNNKLMSINEFPEFWGSTSYYAYENLGSFILDSNIKEVREKDEFREEDSEYIHQMQFNLYTKVLYINESWTSFVDDKKEAIKSYESMKRYYECQEIELFALK